VLPLLLVVATIIIAYLLAISARYVVNDLLLRTTRKRVEVLRDLPALYTVEYTLLAQEKWQESIVARVRSSLSPSEIRGYALKLVAFDVFDDTVYVQNHFAGWYTDAMVGVYGSDFYGGEEGWVGIGLAGWFVGPFEELIYVHEFTHALQDQHFGIGASPLIADSDQFLARTALVEGDAELVQRMYMDVHFSDRGETRAVRQAARLRGSELEGVPQELVAQLGFPYEYGVGFVETLYGLGGWERVNAAYEGPPLSTEQVLHIERYIAGEEPVVVNVYDLSDVLGDRWGEVDRGVLGEYLTWRYLAQAIPEEDARVAAEGWGGDRYAVYYEMSERQLALVLRSVWDAVAEAEEFATAYVGYGDARDPDARRIEEGDRTCWVAEDDYLCLELDEVETTIVLGPEEEIVELIFGALEDQ
jgi:hypothetical protein